MDKKFTTIDEYINSFPEEIQQILNKLRRTVREAAPDAVEAISYQMPTFKLDGKNLVHFAAFRTHIGFYPTPSGIETLKEELSSYITGKGTITFHLGQTIPYDLVKKVVLLRVKNIRAQ